MQSSETSSSSRPIKSQKLNLRPNRRLLLLLLVVVGPNRPVNCQQNHTTNQKAPNYLETGRQITGILDRFMSLGYDKRVRPNYGGPPVEVNVTMRILSISSVSEVMMDFTADFYFRQTWHDPRLAFKKLGDIQTLYVGAEVSKKIWLPDTFFGNEKLAYFHEATTPNVFLRIDHSGEVYRSIRLTVTSSCPMNLQYFPMDRQRCTIEAESYGYNVKDIIYRWARKDTAVERDKEISLPQFDIVKTVQKYRLEELSSGTYSRLIAEIHFARRMGYYLIQIYIPSSLIVVISWVSFWLHRNASPARVQLGVTTVLTMTTLMSSTNAALPKISYVKSIDIFLGTCFVMVFAALLEYATVGYLGKRIAMRKAHVQHAQSQAQARAFAQLQAQGAQGDPVPPITTTNATAADAAPSINININNGQLQPQLICTSGPEVATSATDQQQAIMMQQLLAQAGGGNLLLSTDHRGGQVADPHNNIPPEVPERSHCNHCHTLSRRDTSGCHAHSGEISCPCPSHASADNSRHRQRSCCARQIRHGQFHPAPSSSLPRNSRRDDKLHNKEHLPPHTVTICSHLLQQDLNQQQQQQPPSYCGSKAATAAAATFVNMHRKNKGLPPSNDPNFVPFTWPGPTGAGVAGILGGNRSLETIFGVRPSDIDKYSRVVFPVCFVCFQLMYWIVYLHISAFLETEYQPNNQAGSTQPPQIPTQAASSTQAPMSLFSTQQPPS